MHFSMATFARFVLLSAIASAVDDFLVKNSKSKNYEGLSSEAIYDLFVNDFARDVGLPKVTVTFLSEKEAVIGWATPVDAVPFKKIFIKYRIPYFVDEMYFQVSSSLNGWTLPGNCFFPALSVSRNRSRTPGVCRREHLRNSGQCCGPVHHTKLW